MLIGEMPKSSKVAIYVDGFNLYYGALKGTPYKWLDLSQLARNFLGGMGNIVKIRYFTAKVYPPPWDPDINIRQEIYLRALQTLPNLEIHYGKFKPRTRRGFYLSGPGRCLACKGELVEIEAPEEKGSDVNLAAYLIYDAARDLYDTAWVVSNDSDLATPIRLVRGYFKKRVGIVLYGSMLTRQQRAPQYVSQELLRATGGLHKFITEDLLRNSLFPDAFHDRRGREHKKPRAW